MKAWYDDIDTAILQRIKTYSAFNDAESKNLMIQTMYEYREKEIAELEKENTELKERIKWYSEQICNKECAEVWGELTKAKNHIHRLLVLLTEGKRSYAVIDEARAFLQGDGCRVRIDKRSD